MSFVLTSSNMDDEARRDILQCLIIIISCSTARHFTWLLMRKINILLNLGLTVFGSADGGGLATSEGRGAGVSLLSGFTCGQNFWRGSLLLEVYGHDVNDWMFKFLLK